MTDFGVDVSTFPDLDPTFAFITGPRVVAEAVARRLCTPRGTLDYDPDYGLDVCGLLSAGIDESRMLSLQGAIEAEAEKDERVLTATARVDANLATESLRVTVSLATADGPFVLTLAVDKLTVSILTAE